MTRATADKFLSLLKPGRTRDRAELALRRMDEAMSIPGIRKSDLDDIKSHLGTALRAMWEVRVAEPFFYAGKWESQPKEVNDLYHAISCYSLHDAIASSKKLAKFNGNQPPIEALREIVAAALPLAESAQFLKQHRISGRAPKADRAPVPSATGHVKVTGTCSCCQRSIAVGNGGEGTMAHHGYSRLGYGYQTASCRGIGFKPLEKSLEGLEKFIEEIEIHRARASKTLLGADDLSEVTLTNYSARTNTEKTVTVLKGQPEFPLAVARFKRKLEGDIQHMDMHLKHLNETLVIWQAYHEKLEPGLDNLPNPS